MQEFKNIDENDIKFAVTAVIPISDSQNLIERLKENDLKFSAKYDENKISLTYSAEDSQKFGDILKSFANKISPDVELPKSEKKEAVLPFLDVISNVQKKNINHLNRKAIAHQEHINLIRNSLSELELKADKLKNSNIMLKNIANTFSFIRSPINAVISRNEKKIYNLRSKAIPNLKKQIAHHNNSINILYKKSGVCRDKMQFCQHLNTLIKSFVITDKAQRNQQFFSAMMNLNRHMQKINSNKLEACIDRMEQIQKSFPDLSTKDKEKANLEYNKLKKQKNSLSSKMERLNSAQIQYSDMINKSEDIQSQTIEKTEKIVDKSIQTGTTIESIAENIYETQNPNPEKVNKEYEDKDMDLIPDRIDSTFTPPEELNKEKSNNIAKCEVTKEQADYLKSVNFPFSKYKKRGENGQFIKESNLITIGYDKSLNQELISHMQNFKANSKSAESHNETINFKTTRR